MLNYSKGCFRRKISPFLRFAALAIVPAILIFFAGPVSAQRTSGQLTGTVSDPNGAAVVGATVAATQTGTNLQREAITNDDGLYTITDLPIGQYRISVKGTGFKESVSTNVTVNVASVTRQDFRLEVGAVGEVVTIQSDDIQVETQTGTLGEVITGQQVRELPLNGRSFVQLTQLVPGVAPQNNFDSKNKGLFSGVDFSVNGNSAQSNLFLTDGANNNDTGSNRTILLYPSIEAIAEFKMLRNSYGPEYGQAAGAVISIATRGGENDFHGSLFYFGRNDAINATEFFANRGGLGIDKLRRNDFGGSLGGPILKDRLFFFFSTEWNKEIRGKARFGNVPSVAIRTGDFRNPRVIPNGPGTADDNLCDGIPAGGLGILAPANISPAGQSLVKLFPAPNLNWSPSQGDCINWSDSPSSPIDFSEYNIRIDYNVTSKHKIFGRYTEDSWTNAFPILPGAGLWGDDAFPTVETSWSQPARQVAIKLTSTLSNTAINEVQFSYSANRILVDPGNGGDINNEINTRIPGFFPDSAKVNGLDRPHPVFWGGIGPFFSSSGSDLWTQAPFRNALDIYSIRDDFSKVSGNHAFKLGFLYDRASKDEDSGPNNEAVQFWGSPTVPTILTRGSLIGFNESDTQAVGNARWSNLEFYFGDTWKVRPNVTLELGARYSILFEAYDANNEISGFNAAAYNPARPATDPCNGLIVPKGAGNICAGIAGASAPVEFSNRSLRKNNYKNIAPRIGVAWDVFKNGKTAIRGGFGQFFLRERTSPVFAALTQNPPFVKGIGGRRSLDAPVVFADLPASAGAGSPRFSFDPEAATPYSWQFNVLVDQELWKDTVFEVGYVGNRARDQLTNYDINAVLPQNRVAAAFAVDANGVNQFRPFRNYGSIYEFGRRGRANYDSLQILFKTRLTRNSRIDAAYTFSKSKADFGLSDSSGTNSEWALQDVNNPDVDFGLSDINRPHMFVANAIINLPNFKGSNSFVQTLFGGWEVAAIFQITSGTSLTPNIAATGLTYEFNDPSTPGVDTRAFQAGFTGTGTNVANQRPLRTDASCSPSGGDSVQFIDPAAFTLAGVRIGELSPVESRGGCLGSPIKNVDFSIYKNFAPRWLRESFFGEAARIQFRFEMFNAFNTPQFRGDSIGRNFYGGQVVCGTALCSTTNNVITGITGQLPGNFGNASQTRGGREIQYALKFLF